MKRVIHVYDLPKNGEMSKYSLYSTCCDDKITKLFEIIQHPVLKQIIDGNGEGPEMEALQEAISQLFGHLEAKDTACREVLWQAAKDQWLENEA